MTPRRPAFAEASAAGILFLKAITYVSETPFLRRAMSTQLGLRCSSTFLRRIFVRFAAQCGRRAPDPSPPATVLSELDADTGQLTTESQKSFQRQRGS
jgi:hypothetical protein